METRIPASERTSQKLSDLLTQGVAEGDAQSELIKLAVRKIVEEALEAEVAEAVGRGYYESGAVPGAGYRNGYRRGRLRTAEGAIDYGVPVARDRAAGPRLRSPACSATTSSRPTSASCRRWRNASVTTLTPASPTSASRSAIGASHEDQPARLRGAPRAQAHVRGRHPGG